MLCSVLPYIFIVGLAAYVNESTFTTFHSGLSFNNNLQKQLPIKPAPPVTKIVFALFPLSAIIFNYSRSMRFNPVSNEVLDFGENTNRGRFIDEY